MNPEQQRIAIAEARGWKNVDAGAGRVWGFTTRHKGTPSESDVCVDVPDYLNDLNAMHDAEKLLTQWEELVSYHSWLGYCGENNTSELHNCIHATAAQRAEAFLRTIGKWEEAK